MLKTSLAWRLIAWLVVIQSILSALALAASLALWNGPGDEYFFLHETLKARVADTLVRQPDGSLAIADTSTLRQFRQDGPRVKTAAMKDGMMLEGSAPEIVAAMRSLRSPELAGGSAFVREGPLAGLTIVATEFETPYGTIVAIGADNLVKTADLPAIRTFLADHLMRIIGFVLLGAVLVVPLVVWRTLRPLRAATQAAAHVDLRNRDFRLPDHGGVPAELRPLVRSINAALDRLDAGVSQQQRFAAMAAHEMRTPLAILTARIDSLQNPEEAEGMRGDIVRIRTMVDQLLFVARLERRDIQLDEDVDLVALARNVVAECAPLAISIGRDLALVPEVDHLPVTGSARAIESAVSNLVQNAMRMEPAEGTVEVVVRAPADILVIDHGPGIPPAQRGLVFEPFWRRDETYPGAGLGLTIVQEAAAVHGGSVTIEETPGGGATFRLRLGSG
ncbi:HAMP domain-containing sensor histidine kinase [Inquilinus sp.]|uniref:HAMP domain-containing sensor histidine kinase n=1 Tax=Inquilinus sp. TaxID=1932117 RepID=UPI0031D11CCE